MACSGKCFITRSESRNKTLSRNFKKSSENCPNARRRDAEKAVDAYLGPILADARNGCPKCDCEELPDQDPTWGPWRKYQKTISYKKTFGRLECTYTFAFTVEIRKRVFDGVCYEKALPDATVLEFKDDLFMVACEPLDRGAFALIEATEPITFEEFTEKPGRD